MDQLTKLDAERALDGARVLVVEDDFLILTALDSILSDAGAEIVGLCRSVEEALPLAEEDGLTAAVLDFRLGSETVEPVAQRLAERGIPFVFYTGQVRSEATLAEWPNCKVLLKPAPTRMIVAAIAELLKR